MLFAFSTLIGWSYYGETGIVYLLGIRAAVPYRMAWLVFIYLGSVGSLHIVWDIADTLNGLMAIPNLVAVLLSIPLIGGCSGSFRAAGGGGGGRGLTPAGLCGGVAYIPSVSTTHTSLSDSCSSTNSRSRPSVQ